MSTSTMQAAGSFRTVLNILLEPATAFASLRERPTWLLPTLLVAGGTALVMLWYFSILDIPWFLESTLYQGGAEPTQDEIDAFRAGTANLSPLILIISGFLGTILVLLLVWILQAGYLTLVSALTGDGFHFTRWFSLVTWASIPSLLTVIGMAVTVALAHNGQLGPNQLDPMQIGNLGLRFDNPALDNGIGQMSLTQFWTMWLLVYGYRTWRKVSWWKSALIVLLPQLLFFGVGITLSAGAMEFNVTSIEAVNSGDGAVAISVSL